MNTINMISAFLASVILVGMAIFILVKDWRNQINRYYVFWNIMGLGILFTMFITYAFSESADLVLLNKVTQMFTVLFFASFFAMSLVFPRGEKPFPFYITLIVLTPAVTVAALVISTDLTIAAAYFKDGELVRELKDFYTYYAIFAFSYLLVGTLNFIRKYFSTKVEIFRLQMRYLFVGSSVALIFAAICSIVLPKAFGYSKLYAIGPAIASFIVTAALFYSVIAYNLMDIRTVIHKTVMYIFLSAVVFIPIYVMIIMYYNGVLFFDRVPIAVIAPLIVLVFIVISLFVSPWIDRLFQRRQNIFETIVDTFVREVGEMKEPEPVLGTAVNKIYKSLFVKKAFVMNLSKSTREYVQGYARGLREEEVENIDRNDILIRWFARNQEILNINRIYTDDREFGNIREEILVFFIKNDIITILPLYHDKSVYALICLGEKDSLASYSPQEIDILSAFRKECNEVFSNTLTYARASEEQLKNRAYDFSGYILDRSTPDTLPAVPGIKFGAFLVPKYETGGDYFDIIPFGDQGVGVIATDVSGAGINSALYSILLRSSFHASLNDAPSTFSVTHNLNRVLYEYSGGKGDLVTSLYFYYDLKSSRLIYTNAGFPALELFRIEKNNFDSLDTEGVPLGYDRTSNFGTGRTNLVRGDIGVLYSRSLINSKDQKGERFGLVRLREIIRENRSHRPTEIAQMIKDSFEAFTGLTAPESDIMSILFKVV